MADEPHQPPPKDIHATHVTCAYCGYNLTGATIGGSCPECGAPVEQTLQRGALPTSGMATASMVLGICSLVTCSCYGVPGLICAVLAIIFWYSARDAIKEGRVSPGSQGMATAGLVTGLITISMLLVAVAFVAVMVLIETLNP